MRVMIHHAIIGSICKNTIVFCIREKIICMAEQTAQAATRCRLKSCQMACEVISSHSF